MTFDIGAYDATRPLVIDPQVVSYSTYLGGPNYDYGYDIAVDKFGSVYVTGEAGSEFPLNDSLQQYAGGKEAFVSKFSPDGSTLLYSTYIGGSHVDSADSIALDYKGAAYITGHTESGNFPTTAGAFQPKNGHGTCDGNAYCADAFVTKLSPNGDALVYSTYLGVGSIEAGDGIAVDADGSAYVMGQTNAPNFYTLNAVQSTFGGGSCDGGFCFDAFVTKFNSTGSALVYSTYLGGNRDEARFFHQAGDLAVDSAGHAYVTGYTESGNFPTYNALQSTYKLKSDAYVTKLSPEGSAFVYSTYLGGSIGENGAGITADAAGNAYVTGSSASDDFPATPGSFQPVKTGGGNNRDAFVSKLGPDGSELVYSTFLGGTESGEFGGDIAVDKARHVYVTGSTYSRDFPTRNAFQPVHGGGSNDAFVAKFTPGGDDLVYSSYLGGGGDDGIDDGHDVGSGIVVDQFGNAYLTGRTHSKTFPTMKPHQAQNAGYYDAFVTKISRYGRETLTQNEV